MYENIQELISDGKIIFKEIVESLPGKILGSIGFALLKKWVLDGLARWRERRRAVRSEGHYEHYPERPRRVVTLFVPDDGPNGFSLPGGIGPGSGFKLDLNTNAILPE